MCGQAKKHDVTCSLSLYRALNHKNTFTCNNNNNKTTTTNLFSTALTHKSVTPQHAKFL